MVMMPRQHSIMTAVDPNKINTAPRKSKTSASSIRPSVTECPAFYRINFTPAPGDTLLTGRGQKKQKKVVHLKSYPRSKKLLYIYSVSCTRKIIVQKGVLSASFVHRHFTNVHVRDSVLYPPPLFGILSFDGMWVMMKSADTYLPRLTEGCESV